MWPFKKHDNSDLLAEVAKLRSEVKGISGTAVLALTRAQKALNTVAELRRELGEPTQPQEPQAAPKVKAKARTKTQASKKEIAVRHRNGQAPIQQRHNEPRRRKGVQVKDGPSHCLRRAQAPRKRFDRRPNRLHHRAFRRHDSPAPARTARGGKRGKTGRDAAHSGKPGCTHLQSEGSLMGHLEERVKQESGQ
jgi:hypothetical protein